MLSRAKNLLEEVTKAAEYVQTEIQGVLFCLNNLFKAVSINRNKVRKRQETAQKKLEKRGGRTRRKL